MAPSLLSPPAALTYPCVSVGGFSSFRRWWNFCHSSSPCRWTASRRCACACEPGASAARRSSSRSPRRRTWTSGRSLETKEPNKEKLAPGLMYRELKRDIHRCQSSAQLRPNLLCRREKASEAVTVRACERVPVRFEVILEMGRPGERPAAAFKRAAQDLLGERTAALRGPVSISRRVVCVVT